MPKSPRTDWWSCDGHGHSAAPVAKPRVAPTFSRRGVLTGAAVGAVGWLAGSRALAQLAVAPKGVPGRRDVLVSIFLRGGMDGLNVVTPYGEDAYYKLRPSLAIPRPGAAGGKPGERLLDLDGFFGLNPALAPLLPFYRDGRLAFVHAVGSGDPSHSHFEAMEAMERGLHRNGERSASGWLSRHLLATPARKETPLRAVALSGTLPTSLSGATEALAMESLDEFKLNLDPTQEPLFQQGLEELYGEGKDVLTTAGRETLEVLKTLNRLNPAAYRASHGAAYPKSDLGLALRQVAFLIRADVGLEVAVLDRGGWDTHFIQGSTSGILTNQLDDVGKSLAAFATDLGPELGSVTVVLQTEFGRRAYENSSGGTDHGHGSVMTVLGGGTKGGKVYGRWPGLSESRLDGPGDLAVTTDYRSVLSEVLAKRMGNRELGSVFPDFGAANVGVV
ncbi:MAG TPA: DUF1501 domain-containing protein [Fimbriimonadaceae bacterium]|nr:DUF1501 domain-containing protein [Fimbriimonadaceae bacterium]